MVKCLDREDRYIVISVIVIWIVIIWDRNSLYIGTNVIEIGIIIAWDCNCIRETLVIIYKYQLFTSVTDLGCLPHHGTRTLHMWYFCLHFITMYQFSNTNSVGIWLVWYNSSSCNVITGGRNSLVRSLLTVATVWDKQIPYYWLGYWWSVGPDSVEYNTDEISPYLWWCYNKQGRVVYVSYGPCDGLVPSSINANTILLFIC